MLLFHVLYFLRCLGDECATLLFFRCLGEEDDATRDGDDDFDLKLAEASLPVPDTQNTNKS